MLLPSVVSAPFRLTVKSLKMVSIKFLVLLIAVSGESIASLLPKVILQLVQRNYGERPMVIEVFHTSKKVKILDETLKLLSGVKQKVTPINITEIILSENTQPQMECYYDYTIKCPQNYSDDAIFLFDTLDNYQTWKKHFEFTQRFTGRLNLNHLVYCEDARQENIKKIITSGTYESFLLEHNDQVSLHAMTMFTEKQCRPEQLVEINQFSRLESKWKTDKFFRARVESFHGCTLRINIYPNMMENQMPFLRRLKVGDETFFEGAIVDMLNSLSTHLNFTYLHSEAAQVDAKESGLSGWELFDIHFTIKLLEGFNQPSSYPIYSTADVAVVPPGELFTSWEKLLMPFDRPTWMWLGIVFAIAFLVILLIKWSKSTSMYDLVIGSNVTTPTLNVIAIFMGTGQNLLPQRNVTRFMFISFILFCLIMRTAYQGKYFEFLTSDMRRKPIQTIEELKDKNFTAIGDELICPKFYCKFDLLAG